MVGTLSQSWKNCPHAVLRREKTHTDNYFLSSILLCEHMCQTYLNFDHETHAEFNVKRSIGWGGTTVPLLGDYNERGCPPLCWVTVGAKWISAKATTWNHVPTIVKIRLSREKGLSRMKNPHSAIASLIPPGNQLQQGWEKVVWKVCPV